jgi:hypothetical protein
MDNLLRIAKENFKKGTAFLSASGLCHTTLTVSGDIYYGENFRHNIYCEGGLLYDAEFKRWATILK